VCREKEGRRKRERERERERGFFFIGKAGEFFRPRSLGLKRREAAERDFAKRQRKSALTTRFVPLTSWRVIERIGHAYFTIHDVAALFGVLSFHCFALP
jgi:hypothetical protein